MRRDSVFSRGNSIHKSWKVRESIAGTFEDLKLSMTNSNFEGIS